MTLLSQRCDNIVILLRQRCDAAKIGTRHLPESPCFSQLHLRCFSIRCICHLLGKTFHALTWCSKPCPYALTGCFAPASSGWMLLLLSSRSCFAPALLLITWLLALWLTRMSSPGLVKKGTQFKKTKTTTVAQCSDNIANNVWKQLHNVVQSLHNYVWAQKQCVCTRWPNLLKMTKGWIKGDSNL